MSAPRHARRRSGGRGRVAPAALAVPGFALLGCSVWLGTAGAATSEPPLGPHVADVRPAGRVADPPVRLPADRAGSVRPGRSVVPAPAGPDPAVQVDGGTPDGPVEVTTPPGGLAPPPARPVVDDPVAVSVPALDLHAPLVDLGLDVQGRLEVPADADLAGWWTGGPAPGQDGPAVIAGHVDSARGPAVFWRLGELGPGDHVVVHDEDGTALTFVVDGVGRWPKDEFPTEAVYLEADGPELRLITCGGEFDRHVGSYRDNVVVFASAA